MAVVTETVVGEVVATVGAAAADETMAGGEAVDVVDGAAARFSPSSPFSASITTASSSSSGTELMMARARTRGMTRANGEDAPSEEIPDRRSGIWLRLIDAGVIGSCEA